jgi:hypothetical protein
MKFEKLFLQLIQNINSWRPRIWEPAIQRTVEQRFILSTLQQNSTNTLVPAIQVLQNLVFLRLTIEPVFCSSCFQ